MGQGIGGGEDRGSSEASLRKVREALVAFWVSSLQSSTKTSSEVRSTYQPIVIPAIISVDVANVITACQKECNGPCETNCHSGEQASRDQALPESRCSNRPVPVGLALRMNPGSMARQAMTQTGDGI